MFLSLSLSRLASPHVVYSIFFFFFFFRIIRATILSRYGKTQESYRFELSEFRNECCLVDKFQARLYTCVPNC